MKRSRYEVRNMWRRPLVINLSRPKLDSQGRPLRQMEIEEDLPATYHPTDQGTRKEYRIRRGQLQMVDRGRSIHLRARGENGDTIVLKEYQLRSPDLQAKLRAGAVRIRQLGPGEL